MQVIGMYGYIDKYDFVLAISRAISIMGKSVLVIDATSDKKYKYIIPAISNSEKYLTQYSEIDFAIGFDSYSDVTSYLTENNIDINKYSYVILDVENAAMYEKFSEVIPNKSYLFIATNLVSVNRNDELVKKMRELHPENELKFTKVLYRAYLSRSASNYLDEKIANYGVTWTEENYDVNNDEQDVMASLDSQYSGIIDIRKHTKPYVLFLCEFASKLMGDESPKDILKEIKRRKN